MISLSDQSSKLFDFLKHITREGQKIPLRFLPIKPDALEIEYGHAVSIFCQEGSVSLWDPNGFSFEAQDLETFTERMRGWCLSTFPKSREEGMLSINATGISSSNSQLDRTINIDQTYDPLFQPTEDVTFRLGVQRMDSGGIKLVIGLHYFLDAIYSGVPQVLPEFFSNPLLVRYAFFDLETEGQKAGLKTQYSVPKKSFLSNFDSSKNFFSTAKKACALLRAFEVVSNFSNKAYARSELKLDKLSKRAKKSGLKKEDLLPKTHHQSALWDQVEEFYNTIGYNLYVLEWLSDVEKHFNLPEADAIAKKFKSANVAGKTQLLKTYVEAARKANGLPLSDL